MIGKIKNNDRETKESKTGSTINMNQHQTCFMALETQRKCRNGRREGKVLN